MTWSVRTRVIGTHASSGVSSGEVDTQSTKLFTVSEFETNEQDKTLAFAKDAHGVTSINANPMDSTVAVLEYASNLHLSFAACSVIGAVRTS
jgi:6-phosphogluconolactonase (cycloisomerase 2 family)